MGEKKRDYYEVLGVDSKVEQDDLKKIYRKMALKLHPDKNGDTEEAKLNFQELNEAYQTLSDPQERAWYDSHKNQILAGKDICQTGQDDDFNFNVFEFFSASCFDGYDETNKKNFFKVYRNVFE